MPRYNYECPTCGSFDAMRPLAAYAEPCACPACGTPAPRSLAAARIASGVTPSAAAPARRHRSGCGCCTPALGRTMRADAVAAGAPRRGPTPPAGSFLTRNA